MTEGSCMARHPGSAQSHHYRLEPTIDLCSMDMTVLERQRTRLKWLKPQDFGGSASTNLFPTGSQADKHQESSTALIEMLSRADGRDGGWPDLTAGYLAQGGGFEPLPEPARLGFGTGGSAAANNSEMEAACRGLGQAAISRSSSCPADIDGQEEDEKGRVAASLKGSFKKRKAEKAQGHASEASSPKGMVTEEMKDKRIKGERDGDGDEEVSKQRRNNNNNTSEMSVETTKDSSKASEVQKPDYIHVRARRGQATDSHSLAERVRREKISERMKYLQDLVPGCNKITGKAGMLDEIINYVQSLQQQVEFLSMKLAAVNPRLDFNIDNFFTKEIFSPCNSSMVSPELASASYLHFNTAQPAAMQPVTPCCGLDVPISTTEALRRTTSGPVTIPDPFIEPGFQGNGSLPTWDADLQALYNMGFLQGRPAAFPSPPFPGTQEANNLKMEM
ncbi:hypothetical protein AMTRI_Chr03g143770 [Amborella trichopoda]